MIRKAPQKIDWLHATTAIWWLLGVGAAGQYQLHACEYAAFLTRENTHSEIYFSWNEAIDPYIEQILTT